MYITFLSKTKHTAGAFGGAVCHYRSIRTTISAVFQFQGFSLELSLHFRLQGCLTAGTIDKFFIFLARVYFIRTCLPCFGSELL